MIDIEKAMKSEKLCFFTKDGRATSTMIERGFIDKLERKFAGLNRYEWLGGTKEEAERYGVSHARYLRALCI